MKGESDLIRSIVVLFVFGLVLFGVHFLLGRAFEVCYAPKIYEAHVFMLVLTIVVMFVLKLLFRKMKQKMQGLFGYVFMAGSLVKMALAVVFLIPIIKCDADYRIPYVIQFFVVYFFYLFMEVYLIARQLKEQSQEKIEEIIKQN